MGEGEVGKAMGDKGEYGALTMKCHVSDRLQDYCPLGCSVLPQAHVNGTNPCVPKALIL